MTLTAVRTGADNVSMDGPAGSVDHPETDELARLRWRAYGPDADIAGDAVAIARLLELEAAHRSTTPAAAEDLAPIAVTAADASAADAGTAAVESDRPSPVGPTPIRRRRWLPYAGAVSASLALLAAYAVVTGVAPTNRTPRADDVLAPEREVTTADFLLAEVPDGATPPDPHGSLDRLGLQAKDLQRYQDFEQLGVWSGLSHFGTTCLLVANPNQGLNDELGTEGCSPPGVDTPADLLFLGPQSRTLIRFVLDDGYVAVHVYAKARPRRP
jgi:hypothetical protein